MKKKLITMLMRMMRGAVAGLCLLGMAGGAVAEEQGAENGKGAAQARIYAQLGHSADVNAVAFSPDGRTLVSGSEDETIRLWDVASGRELRTLTGHGGSFFSRVNSVAFSPDGLSIVSGSSDKTLKLWDVGSGRVLRTLTGHGDAVYSVAFSSDGRSIVSGSFDNTLKLWDVASGRELRTFSGHSAWVRTVAISPDGRTLVSGSDDKTLKLWDAASGRELRTLIGHKETVYSVAFSPDGRHIISGSLDKTLKLWDVAKGRVLRTLLGHKGEVDSVVFSPDGRSIISSSGEDVTGGDGDGTIKIWDVASGHVLRTIVEHHDAKAIAISPDGRSIVSGNIDGSLKLWDVTSGREPRTLASDDRNSARVIALSPEGLSIISVTDSTLRFWDAASGRVLRTLEGDTSVAAFSPDGRSIVVNRGATLKLWDVASGRELRTLSDSSWASSVAFSPDGHSIVGSQGKTLKLWDVASGRELRTLSGHSGQVNSVAFSPDGRSIVSGGKDDTSVVKLWDVASGRVLGTITGSGWVNSVVFSPDGLSIVFDWNNNLELLDVASWRIQRTLAGHSNTVRSVVFSQDGRSIVSCSDDKTLKLWDSASGRELRTMSGHSEGVNSVALSSNERFIFSTSWDGTIRKWDVATGKELAQFISFSDGEWVTITPEGYYDASEHGDKHLNVRVGNGLHEVYGIDQYRESFYRPDLVKLALSGGSTKDFRNIASVKPAPQVVIADTPASTSDSEAKITLKLTDMGGGIGDVRLYLNGSAVMLDNSRALKRVTTDDGSSITKSYTLKLSNGKNAIRAIAFNADNSMQSLDALHEINATIKALTKPTLHAIVVGIKEFRNPKLNLEFPIADADLFAEALTKSATGLFETVDIKKLTTREETTRENIQKELTALRSLNPDDLFVFYVASHGTVDDGEYFLITSNVGITSTERLKTDALPQTELKELIANIPATKKVIVLDTCNAGAMGDALQKAMLTRGMSEDTAIKILRRAVGATIFSASTSTQEALEGYKGHGLFTYVLAEGLSGKADKGKTGFIKTNDLVDYVDTNVPEIAEKEFKRAQFPNNSSNGQGFHLGRVVP